jgi:hypothetical protein
MNAVSAAGPPSPSAERESDDPEARSTERFRARVNLWLCSFVTSQAQRMVREQVSSRRCPMRTTNVR